MRTQLLCASLTAGILLSGMAHAGQVCQTVTITADAPDSRYTDNGDGSVTDNTTGLMWEQCPEGLSTASTACDTGTLVTYTWQEALQLAQTMDAGGGFAGHTDWRLPSRKELYSLVDFQCSAPSINSTLFPNTPTSTFWTSSPYAGNASYKWGVGFDIGGSNYNGKLNTLYVRLVRGG